MYRDFAHSRSPTPIASGEPNQSHRIRVTQTGFARWKQHRTGRIVLALLALIHLSSEPLPADIDWSEPVTFERAYQIALGSTPVNALLVAELEFAEGQLDRLCFWMYRSINTMKLRGIL